MSALRGNRGGCAVRVNVTRGSSGGGEEGSNQIEGDNKGVVAGGGRLRAEGRNRSKGRSAGGRVIQGLVLLMLCALGGADTGGSWQQAGGAVAGGSWQQVGGAVAGGSWQQAGGAVAGGSWQQAGGAVAGGSWQQAGGAVAGGSWQQAGGAVAGGSWQQAGGAVAGGSWQQAGGAVAGGSWQQANGAVAGGSWQQAGGAAAGGSWKQANGVEIGDSGQQARSAVSGGSWQQTSAGWAGGSWQQAGSSTGGGNSRCRGSSEDGSNGRCRSSSGGRGSSRCRGSSTDSGGSERGGNSRIQGGSRIAALGDTSMGAVSAASGCSVGGSQWEPALSVADGLLEPLDCQVHVNDMSKFGASLSCGYAQASVAGRGGLCVVTAGLSVCAVPIVGLCHHCWGEGIPLMWDYDLATVDCWQSHSTCHCLQQSRQFGLGVSKVCTGVGVARGRVSCSTVRVPAWGAGGGGAEGGSSSCTDETSCCRTAAEPARPLTITVCAGRWGGGGCGGGSGGGAGLSGERLGRELAEWRSQGSELAEWRSQARELAESAAGCRTVKSGCRTVPAQAVHISTHWDLELWVSPERGYSPVEVRLCIVSLASVSQCSLCLCFSRGLLQRTSQGAGLAMGQWVVERWPTMHSNSASKMGAARNWVLRGDCWAETGFLSGSTLCSRTRGVLQAEGRVRLWQWSDQLVLMDSQCGVQPHWPRPPPVYKGPQQWDDGAQRREQVENLEVAGGSWEAMLLAILSQLYMALATRARGAAGSGRRWRIVT